jgi:hypothetical protein
MIGILKSSLAHRFIGGFVIGAFALLAMPGLHL